MFQTVACETAKIFQKQWNIHKFNIEPIEIEEICIQQDHYDHIENLEHFGFFDNVTKMLFDRVVQVAPLKPRRLRKAHSSGLGLFCS